MTLKARIAIGFAAIIAVLLAGMVAVINSEHDNLVDQLDSQLEAASVLALGRPLPGGAMPDMVPVPDLEAPVSDLYVGVIDQDARQFDIIVGRLLDGPPSITLDQVDRTDGQRFFDAPGSTTSQDFRVLAVEHENGTWGVIALPLANTQEATRELVFSLGLVSSIIILALALISWWIVRLGLRPIAAVTEAADLITAGQTTHRVDVEAPRTEAGRLATAFNVMLDERDANEHLLRQFVANASHELRTPLTSMRGYLDLYAGGGFRDAGSLDDAMRRMRSETMRMNELVEDLLLLASLDQGRPLTRTTVDLADVLRDAASDAHAINPDRPIDVDVDTPKPSDLIIEGDDALLRQVIASLVHNAIVHTPPHTAVHLQATPGRKHVAITVSDDGPGLGEEDADHVFDRFYRGDSSRQRHAGGSGLGLSIAKSLIEAHNGTITLRTAPGRGCIFEIQLPRRPSEPDSPLAG